MINSKSSLKQTQASRALLSAVMTVSLGLWGCAPEISLEGRECPCTSGYVCCAAANLCVREGVSCSEARGGRPVVLASYDDWGMPSCMAVDSRNVYFFGASALSGFPKTGGAIQGVLAGDAVEPSCFLVPADGTLYVGNDDSLARIPLGAEPSPMFASEYLEPQPYFRRPRSVTHAERFLYTLSEPNDEPNLPAEVSSQKIERWDLAHPRPNALGLATLRGYSSLTAANFVVRDGAYYLTLNDNVTTRILKGAESGGSLMELARRTSPVKGLIPAGKYVFWLEPSSGRLLAVDAAIPEGWTEEETIPGTQHGTGILDGGPRRQVTEILGGLNNVTGMIAIGERLYVVNGRSLHIIPAGGGETRIEALESYVHLMATDGELLYWMDVNRKVWAARFD